MTETLEFREINDENCREVIKLSDTLTESQKKCVATNAISIAQGGISGYSWFRAIYLQDKPIGFVMLDLYIDEIPEQEQPSLYLWRFMIARQWQGKGYGKQVLDMIVNYFQKQGARTMYTSCVEKEEDSPYNFYMKYGFIDTGKEAAGEEILKYDFPPPPDPETQVKPAPRPWEFMIPNIALITIWTDQFQVMKNFYHKVMGLYIKTEHENYLEFEHNKVRFAICDRKVMKEASPEFEKKADGVSFSLAFPCFKPEHVDITYERLVKHGAGAVASPQNMPWNQRMALFSDPEGNIHEVFAELKPEKSDSN